MNTLEQYEAAIAKLKNVERKGKTMPYTSLNGHMFSFLDKEGNLSIRLNEKEREAFLKKHNSKLSEQHGRIMKEYVLVPGSIAKDASKLTKYLQLSFEYVSTLKPKK